MRTWNMEGCSPTCLPTTIDLPTTRYLEMVCSVNQTLEDTISDDGGEREDKQWVEIMRKEVQRVLVHYPLTL